MKPPQFATEYQQHAEELRKQLDASMKPPQFATEYATGGIRHPQIGIASMKPPQFATEYIGISVLTASTLTCFNEAAAICDGILYRRERHVGILHVLQ